MPKPESLSPGRLFTYTLICLLAAGWLTYSVIQVHHRVTEPVPLSPSIAISAPMAPTPRPLLSPPSSSPATAPELGDDASAIAAAAASATTPPAKRRSVRASTTVLVVAATGTEFRIPVDFHHSSASASGFRMNLFISASPDWPWQDPVAAALAATSIPIYRERHGTRTVQGSFTVPDFPGYATIPITEAFQHGDIVVIPWRPWLSPAASLASLIDNASNDPATRPVYLIPSSPRPTLPPWRTATETVQ